MADQQQAAAPLLQLLRQGRAAGSVQMIAGLVQNQKVGLGQLCTQQRHAHGLAATELAGRCLRCQRRQADPFELHLKLLTYVPALG